MFEPTSTQVISANPYMEGWDHQKLALEIHEFPSILQPQNRVTYVFSHANGFHKEAYRPLMQSLRDYLRSRKEYDTTEIRMIGWDARSQGDSARLNRDKFSLRYKNLDHALDTKHIVDTFKENDSLPHQWIGVGHSFGASSMLILEALYPHTFDSLCLLEAVVMKEFFPMELVEQGPLFTSIRRRDEWANRKDCMDSLLKRKFWQALHPEVLKNYVEYGMYDTEQGTIKLKCPKEHEYHTYMCTNAESVTTFNCVKLIQVPAHFVFAERSLLKHDETIEEMIKCNPKVTVEYNEGSHMMPCEFPDAMVPHMVKNLTVNNKAKAKL
ncbi:Alpha/beta hydrolase fold-1 [Sporodiniella umbellata]|nr:Alpha/beta hydrolase fold-1 [Sporodiniella umbellata]